MTEAGAHEANGSLGVVLAALAGNLAIVVVKFVAFALTRSTAMLTEAIHSTVDSLDQVLLLVGQARARRPPDESHAFGYGMEAFFWSFIVALLIFGAGGAVSIWQGAHKLLSPQPMERPWINFVVLALCAVFEGSSFAVAYREFRRFMRGRRRSLPLWQFLTASKDPTLIATLLEDGAALAGLAIAALGVAGQSLLGLAWADGAASIAIGLLLVLVALFLANETRSLIAGEAAAPPIVEAVRQILNDDPNVEAVTDVSSLHLGPTQILIAITLRLRRGDGAASSLQNVAALEAAVRTADDRICSVYFRPEPPADEA
ncbi:MAG TPA: cation diffusion facilitator family transporter [Caulobacteraceae bacterium]|nr:cation diffusion facilitator family transporter [Caulobacteraceae bacterium]